MSTSEFVKDQSRDKCRVIDHWKSSIDSAEQSRDGLQQGEYLLVLTCTINPNAGWSPPDRSDPEVRMADYCWALENWLQLRDPRLSSILLIENSGSSLTKLQRIAIERNSLGKAIEMVSLDCNYYPRGVHYGYAELAMLEKGLARSQLAVGHSAFIKVTGRLFFPRLPTLLDTLPKELLFAVDTRVHWRSLRRAPPTVFAALMILGKQFWLSRVVGQKEALGPGMTHIENLFAHICGAERNNPAAVNRWKVNCDPIGHAAHWNKNYGSVRERAKNGLRAFMRLVAPSMWI